eukprot:9256967-Alexandrium_andersonii.AAC.1
MRLVARADAATQTTLFGRRAWAQTESSARRSRPTQTRPADRASQATQTPPADRPLIHGRHVSRQLL